MTRPKVPDDKRRRTAQACSRCKRRKSKCNGQKPCQTCTKRGWTCFYTSNDAAEYPGADVGASPTKRRHIDTSPRSIGAALDGAGSSPPIPGGHNQPQHWGEDELGASQPNRGDTPISPPTAQMTQMTQITQTVYTTQPVQSPSTHGHAPKPPVYSPRSQPPLASPNGRSEETDIYTEARMLEDQTGRLLYIGDTSTLSILQLIRIIVEDTAGADIASPFIYDPKRHRIMEHSIDFPANAVVPSLLPDRQTANILIDSYFTNTCGIMEVFDKQSFMASVDACYRYSSAASNYFLCHLFLVFALGLLFATPVPGSPEEAVIEKQLSAGPDRPELFFRSARYMSDREAGFEDADFWSIQTLSLMTVYMLSVSKRNRAYAYLGMAVRSAYALGLHREEAMYKLIFSQAEMKIRRNMWKTLLILDRLLAATLGRPAAISEDDCP
ncbi:fungal-specific transcription factor domain-containing protein [Lasiosphaeria miniovina]|uniref:Fungal-specific transcription factor domain-containing protein n=1 Tax=Lasiosphaeria miniovina TaxID=1954250 RepID=A0AA40BI85_9PEZI|nr:fungal-specific transcription factor domain-containing protein [Lasiosphaeria miniovina]KAK0734711.1 fungal-specific transcription factor domain-containing protein [Lasiosphaeria miniovina]